MLLELDESDGTIDYHSPEFTTILNCDWDHVDRYKSPEDLNFVFEELFKRTEERVIVPSGTTLEVSVIRFQRKRPKPSSYQRIRSIS